MAKKKEELDFRILTGAYDEEFPDCCGITIKANLYDIYDDEYNNTETVWNHEKNLYETRPIPPVSRREAFKQFFPPGSPKLLLFATIPNQRQAAKALKALGATVLDTTRSRAGRYDITLWGLKKPQRKSPTRKTAV